MRRAVIRRTGNGSGWSVLGLWLALALAQPAVVAEEMQLRFEGGRVTLIANGVPLQAVLAAWAEAGRMRFIDADALNGEPVTLHMVDVDEGDALRTLLRPAGGYIAARRAADAAGAAQFDRVKILPAGATQPPAGPRAPETARSGRPTASPDEEVQLDHLQALLEQAAGPARRPDRADSTVNPPAAGAVPLSPLPGIAGAPQRPPRWQRPRGRTPVGQPTVDVPAAPSR